MKVRMWTVGLATFCCMVAFGSMRSAAGGKKKKDQPKLPEILNPGPEHKLLKKTGKWTYTGKGWFEPGKDPIEMKGSTNCKMILGGRYLQESHKGKMMGMNFQGMGISAYDRGQKKWISSWVDNMGTGFMVSEGKYDSAKKTWTYIGTSFDATSGKNMNFKTIIHRPNADTETMEMFMVMGDQSIKMLDLRYTRATPKTKKKDG